MPIDQTTFNLVKGFWIVAGGNEARSDLAAAVAFAGSSGCQYALAGPVDIRPEKVCHWTVTNGENSCGYWQINLRAHPSYSAPSIFNAIVNAKAAIAISRDGDDWGAWTTYTRGAYKTYLERFAGGQPITGREPPPPDHYGDTATLAAGVWDAGWKHLSRTLTVTLPSALTYAQRTGEATLRHLDHSRKVVR